MEVEERSVSSADGTRLATAARGPVGAPVVVLVPGLGLSMHTWSAVASLLADGHRVVTYDLRGNAASARAAHGDYGLWAHAEDLRAVLDAHLAPGEEATVAGHSFGAGVVAALARHVGTSGLAAAVVVGSSGAAITLPGLQGPAWARKPLILLWLAALRLAALALGRFRRLEPIADAVVRAITFTPDDPPEPVRTARREFMRSRPRPLAGTALAAGAHDGLDVASALDVPTLVLRGSRDRQVSDADVERLLEALPDATFREIPGAGHNLPLSHPGPVAEQIARWADAQADSVTGAPIALT